MPNDAADWKAYPYKGLPVALDERPPQIAPYQLRLDWQMWFAAMGSPNEYPWTFNLVWKLLHNDPGAVGLFRANPFPHKPPRYIRAVWYRYEFVRPNPQGLWWKRERLGLWLPPLSRRHAGAAASDAERELEIIAVFALPSGAGWLGWEASCGPELSCLARNIRGPIASADLSTASIG